MKRKLMVGVTLAAVVIVLLLVRLAVIMLVESEYYGQRAKELHERERPIKAARGRIISGMERFSPRIRPCARFL